MIKDQLVERSANCCELCGSINDLNVFEVKPDTMTNLDNALLACSTCKDQINKVKPMDPNHWKCLTNAMWSVVPAIQVVAWRMLSRLKNEAWASDNLDILYLEDEVLEWAKQTGDHHDQIEVGVHKDSNGMILNDGDSVVVTKTLDVKGSSISAKLGTVVKNIRLVPDNPEQIEGRVEGQLIVILTKYLRKQ